jgi:hypothetical protein
MLTVPPSANAFAGVALSEHDVGGELVSSTAPDFLHFHRTRPSLFHLKSAGIAKESDVIPP